MGLLLLLHEAADGEAKESKKSNSFKKNGVANS